MKHRLAGIFTVLAAALILGTAYFAQYVLLLAPCELCLWERWPYRIVAMLGILASLSRPANARVILGIAVLVLLAGAAIAAIHVGVERHWWPSPAPECNAHFTPGAPLPAHPALPCDAPVYLFPMIPVSMALMDFCAALAFALALGAYVSRRKRRFR